MVAAISAENSCQRAHGSSKGRAHPRWGLLRAEIPPSSASPQAVKELPDLDVTLRGAISLARRLQDPLAELVKIDPKSLGVGMYQHDVDQKKLAGKLDEVVVSAVSAVRCSPSSLPLSLPPCLPAHSPTCCPASLVSVETLPLPRIPALCRCARGSRR